MRSRSTTLGAAMLLFAAAAAAGQQNSSDVIAAMKDRAVVLEMTARVVERDVAETWNSATSKVTIPGRPVTLKLVGPTLVVAVQFTPYQKEDGKNLLVAQGQVWVSTKDNGLLYYTSMQTLPVEFGERLYFFPLGQKKDDQGARIEVQLVMKPYSESQSAQDNAPKTGPDRQKGDEPAGSAPSTEKRAEE